MAIPNKISGAVDDAAYTEITTAINTIKEKLPFLVDLSVEEIRELPKLGDKSVAFVQKARDLVEQNSDFLPRSFDIRIFNEDVSLYETLNRIIIPLRMLIEKIEAKITGRVAKNQVKINKIKKQKQRRKRKTKKKLSIND